MKEIIAAYQGRIRAIIKKLTGSYNEDLEQEVYIKTWKNLQSYEEEGHFRQWISAVTANVCRDYFRSRQFKQNQTELRDEEILDNMGVSCPQEEIIDAKTRQKIILRAVDELPRKFREIIIYFEFEEMSYENIAKKTGLPVGTVKSRLFNARQLLSSKLQFLQGDK